MDDLENKLGAILNNPQMMQQIMSMAQAMGGQQRQEPSHPELPKGEETGGEAPVLDLAMVQKLSGLAGKTGIEPREQALLRALGAYLTGERVARLEKAMRAAKMAKLATAVMAQRGLLSGGR